MAIFPALQKLTHMLKRNNSIGLLWCIKIAFSALWNLPDQSCQPKYAPSKLDVNAKIDELNNFKEGMLNFGADSSHIFSFFHEQLNLGRAATLSLNGCQNTISPTQTICHFLGFAFYFIFRFTWLWWRTHFSQIKSFDFLHFFVNLKRKYIMWLFPIRNVSKYQNGPQLFFFCYFKVVAIPYPQQIPSHPHQ